MKKIRWFLGLVLLAGSSFAGVVDSATGKYLYEGEVSGGYGTSQTLSEKESTYVSEIRLKLVKVKYRLSILMGEPVGNYTVYWEIDPTLYLRDGAEKNISAMSKPVQKAFKELKPIDPTEFIIGTSYQHKSNKHQGWMTQNVGFATDGGSLKRSGEGWSFNTPGSPDWSKFILEANSGMVMNSYSPEWDWYLSRSEAKEAFGALQSDAFDLKSIVHLTFGGVSSLNSAIEAEIRKRAERPKVSLEGIGGASKKAVKDPFASGGSSSKVKDPFASGSSKKKVASLDDVFHSVQAEMVMNSVASSTDEKNITIRGTIKKWTALESQTVQVEINGSKRTASVGGGGSFSKELSLSLGSNTIKASYTNKAGKKFERTFNVTRKEPPPKPEQVASTRKSTSRKTSSRTTRSSKSSSKCSSRSRRGGSTSSSSSRSGKEIWYSSSWCQTVTHYPPHWNRPKSIEGKIPRMGVTKYDKYTTDSTFEIYFKQFRGQTGYHTFCVNKWEIEEPNESVLTREGLRRSKSALEDYQMEDIENLYGDEAYYGWSSKVWILRTPDR